MGYSPPGFRVFSWCLRVRGQVAITLLRYLGPEWNHCSAEAIKHSSLNGRNAPRTLKLFARNFTLKLFFLLRNSSLEGEFCWLVFSCVRLRWCYSAAVGESPTPGTNYNTFFFSISKTQLWLLDNLETWFSTYQLVTALQSCTFSCILLVVESFFNSESLIVFLYFPLIVLSVLFCFCRCNLTQWHWKWGSPFTHGCKFHPTDGEGGQTEHFLRAIIEGATNDTYRIALVEDMCR